MHMHHMSLYTHVSYVLRKAAFLERMGSIVSLAWNFLVLNRVGMLVCIGAQRVPSDAFHDVKQHRVTGW
jgi:hypothetical protein